MRIIGGTHRGKQLQAPKNLPVRPTTDFAKEGLFNILNNHLDFENLTVLDLFCGTGNITFEFASRGACKIVAIDKHSPCLHFVRDTSKALGLKVVCTERADAFTYLEKANTPYDVIFADPPYELANIPRIHDLVFGNELLTAEGILIIEHGSKLILNDKPFYKETRNYGNVHFSFFKKEAN